MNHNFTPGQLDASKCATCKYDIISHTNMATCECCPTIGPVEIHKTMLMCPECVIKEKRLEAESIAGAEDRVKTVLERAQSIDYSIKIREDIFNAETVSIAEIKSAIDTDSTIENKRFELAKRLTERYQHFSKVIFDKQQEIDADNTKQRAVQSYLNQLANQLRTEEREKLKLHDINYKPVDKTPKVSKVTTKKGFDKFELVKWANSVDIPLAAFQMVCVAKNMTPEQAAEHFRKIKGM